MSKIRAGHKLVICQSIAKGRELLSAFRSKGHVDLRPKLEAIKSTLERERIEIKKLTNDIVDNIEGDEEIRKELTGKAETFKQVGEVAYLINDALSRPYITSDQNQAANGFEKVTLPKLSL